MLLQLTVLLAAIACNTAQSPPSFTPCSSVSDCAVDYRCTAVPVSSDGTKYCVQSNPAQPYNCTTPSPYSECCKSSDCTNATATGSCDASAGEGWCGGSPPPTNVCRINEWDENTNCEGWEEGWKCIPAGFGGFNHNVCRISGCTSDSECTVKSEGQCLPFWGPDSFSRYCSPALQGFFCAYESDVCKHDKDCGGVRELCVFNMTIGTPQCVESTAPPPAAAPLFQVTN